MKQPLITCTPPSPFISSDDLHSQELNTGFAKEADIGNKEEVGEQREFINGNGLRTEARYNSSFSHKSLIDVKI